MSKVVYIISDVYRSKYFEWLAGEWKNYSADELEFILINCKGNPIESTINSEGYKVHHLNITRRFSFSSMLQLKKLLKELNPAAIHCHLMKANLHGLPAGYLAGVKQRIYTRHHATFHIDYHPKWKQVDKLMNRLSTGIIAISKNVHQVLSVDESVKEDKIIDLPHGFKLSYFRHVNEDDIASIRKKWELPTGKTIGVVSRFIEWKGVKYMVEAFEQLEKEFPDLNFVFLNASGPDNQSIERLISSTLSEKKCRLIAFEDSMPPVYANFNVVVHTPVDARIEAFGQVYVEALAAGVPLVCTLSGIASEFVEDKVNALVVPYKNAEGIAKAVKELLTNEELSNSLVKGGLHSVERFSFDNHMRKLVTIYE